MFKEVRGRVKRLDYIRKILWGKGLPNPLAGKIRILCSVWPPGTEGYQENLDARSALVCMICTSVPVHGSETTYPVIIFGDYFILLLLPSNFSAFLLLL